MLDHLRVFDHGTPRSAFFPFCEIDGLVLRGVQFGVLFFADWGAV